MRICREQSIQNFIGSKSAISNRMSRYNTRRLATRNLLTAGTERVPEFIHNLRGSAFASVDP